MGISKRLFSCVVFAVIGLSALTLACSTEPTPTSAPAATSAPTQAAATDTPVPPTEAAPTPTEAMEAPTPTAAPTAAPTPEPEPTATPGSMMPDVPEEAMAIFEASPADFLAIPLNEDNNSGQSGWASLTAKGTATEVVLLLSPGELDTEAVHIHSGQCGDSLGGVEHPLTSFVDGSGFSVSTVEVEMASLLNGDFAINTHQQGNPGTYTSCGNIPTSAHSITVPLASQNDSGQSGLATLTARGTTTDVVAFLSPGALETELAHIHSGQCGDSLGGVVHPLTSFVGGFGPAVTSVGAPLNSVQTGDFAINTHQAGDPGVYTACGNIARNMDTITINLQEDNNSGQSGVALLTPRGNNTEVWLSLSEGSMESAAVHIHNGQCGDDLGGVEHPLTNFADGTSASYLDGVDLTSLLTGGFAINAHNAQDASVYTACGNIPGIDVAMSSVDFAFDIGELVVNAGDSFTLNLTNEGERPHNIFFHGFDDQNADNERADRLGGNESRVRQFVFDRPGIYPFYCPVGRHEDAGMIGVLRVLGSSEGDPTITLNAPLTTRELEGPEILYGASVTNFNIDQDDPDSGSVRVLLDGTELGSDASVLGSLINLAQGMYTLTAELLNSDGSPLDPPVESSLDFTVEEGDTPAAGSPMLGESPIEGKPKVVVGEQTTSTASQSMSNGSMSDGY